MTHAQAERSAARTLKRLVNTPLSWFGLALRRIERDPACTTEWVQEAGAEGMAVNDFIEKDHRKPARQELEERVFPLVTPRSRICELGPGTGVYTRYLNDWISGGELHVVDSDPNAIAFLRKHLPPNPGTRLHLTEGTRLPLADDAALDLGFGASIFTGGNLCYLFRYLQEFARVLRPGGHLVFDYFDVATDAGWEGLLRNMRRAEPIFAYTYHATATVDRVVEANGFRIVGRHPTVRGSVFVTARRLDPA